MVQLNSGVIGGFEGRRMSTSFESMRLNKDVFEIGSLAGQGDDRQYWWSKSPDERLIALEMMRQSMFGYDPLTDRLQRVLTISSLGER
jgi:hypothetical protein